MSPDPQGFDDGPNRYAYVHNCPLTSYDLYGLWTWESAWGGFSGFWGGVGSSIKEIGSGTYHLSGRMGEWMYADFQYEHFNDSHAFQAKSQKSLEGWKSTGQFAKAACDNPLMFAQAAGEALIPGIMDVCRNPTSSEAWGRATVDVAMIGLAVGKVGQVAKTTGRVGRIAEEGAALDKAIRVDKIVGGAYNRAAHEMYKNNLRSQMSKPYATDYNLNRILDYAYRPNATVGNGSTAAAIRHEKIVGQTIKGCSHSQKGEELINSLDRWLKNNPAASPGNRAAAENVLIDLYNSLK